MYLNAKVFVQTTLKITSYKMKKIGKIGQGFVGAAVREGLKNFYDLITFDLNGDCKYAKYDDRLGKSHCSVPGRMRISVMVDTVFQGTFQH